MIYLASLYSNGAKTESYKDQMIRACRYDYTIMRFAEFANQGFKVFSPIAHFHCASSKYNMPKDYGFFKDFDHEMIEKADEVWVLKMKDSYGSWEKSEGMSDEILFATHLGTPVKFIAADEYNAKIVEAECASLNPWRVF